MSGRKKFGYSWNQKTKSFLKIYSKDILPLKEADRRSLIDELKPFYFEKSLHSLKMNFNAYQKTFRFNSKKNENHFFGSNEDTISHNYSKDEIEKLTSISLRPKEKFLIYNEGEKINFKYNYAFQEITLNINENFIRPDVLLYIKEPYYLAYKWNRMLAIEVRAHHKVEGKKIDLLKKGKIATIEIKLKKKWKILKEELMSSSEKQNLKNHIKNTFKSGYYADFLISKFDQQEKLEKKAIVELENIILKLKSDIESINYEKNKLQDQRKLLLKEIESLKKEDEYNCKLILTKNKDIERFQNENKELFNENKIYEKKLNEANKVFFKMLFGIVFLGIFAIFLLYKLILE